MIDRAGILGSQIRWQTAFRSFTVAVYGPFEKALEGKKMFQHKFARLCYLAPLLSMSQNHYFDGMSDFESINRTWTISTGVKIKEEWIDKGKLGVSTGEGFYSYPNPKYQDSDFLL